MKFSNLFILFISISLFNSIFSMDQDQDQQNLHPNKRKEQDQITEQDSAPLKKIKLSHEADLIDQEQKQEETVTESNKKYFWNSNSPHYLISQAQTTGTASRNLNNFIKFKEQEVRKYFFEQTEQYFQDKIDFCIKPFESYLQTILTIDQEAFPQDYISTKNFVTEKDLPDFINVVHLGVCLDDQNFLKKYLPIFHKNKVFINEPAKISNLYIYCGTTLSFNCGKQYIFKFSTPLSMALENQSHTGHAGFPKEIIELLINNGADVNLEYKSYDPHSDKSKILYYDQNIKNAADQAVHNVLNLFSGDYNNLDTNFIDQVLDIAIMIIEKADKENIKYLRHKYLNIQLIKEYVCCPITIYHHSTDHTRQLKLENSENLSEILLNTFKYLFNQEKPKLEFLY